MTLSHNLSNLFNITRPRHCIGMRFALLETKLTLALMVRKYRFFRTNETDVPLVSDKTAMLNVPKRAIVGIEMRE